MIFSSAILCGGSVCKWFSLFNYSSDFWLILEHCISNTFVLLPPFHLANVLFTHSFIRPISKTRGAGGVAALPLAKGSHHSTPWQMGKKRCRNTFAIDILLGNLSFRKLCEINSNTLSLWPPPAARLLCSKMRLKAWLRITMVQKILTHLLKNFGHQCP